MEKKQKETKGKTIVFKLLKRKERFIPKVSDTQKATLQAII